MMLFSIRKGAASLLTRGEDICHPQHHLWGCHPMLQVSSPSWHWKPCPAPLDNPPGMSQAQL